jgi:hypothetical protein
VRFASRRRSSLRLNSSLRPRCALALEALCLGALSNSRGSRVRGSRSKEEIVRHLCGSLAPDALLFASCDPGGLFGFECEFCFHFMVCCMLASRPIRSKLSPFSHPTLRHPPTHTHFQTPIFIPIFNAPHAYPHPQVMITSLPSTLPVAPTTTCAQTSSTCPSSPSGAAAPPLSPLPVSPAAAPAAAPPVRQTGARPAIPEGGTSAARLTIPEGRMEAARRGVARPRRLAAAAVRAEAGRATPEEGLEARAQRGAAAGVQVGAVRRRGLTARRPRAVAWSGAPPSPLAFSPPCAHMGRS